MLKINGWLRIACLLAAAASFQHRATAAETVRIGGTGSTNEMVKSLAPAFLAETGIAVELIPSLGSGGGIRAAADGVLDLCIAGRPLKPGEQALGLKMTGELSTPFTIVTSHPKPNGLKSAEIAQLYQSDKPTWADGKPIRIILRPTNESDTWLLGQTFPGMEAAIKAVRVRPDLSIAATDQDNTRMAEATAGSLVAATFTQVKMEKRRLQFVAIDGVEPTIENFESGRYPFGKNLFLVVTTKENPVAAKFIAFLRTPKGAAALRDAGVLASAE